MLRAVFGIVAAIVVAASAVPVREDYAQKALVQGGPDEIDNWSEPPESHAPTNAGKNRPRHGGGRGQTHKPRPHGLRHVNTDKQNTEEEVEAKKMSDNSPFLISLPQDKTSRTRKTDAAKEEDVDYYEIVSSKIPERVNHDEAEIELFKSVFGKFLRVLNHKLRPRSRTLEEDRQAVYKPTKWKDLGRNILGSLARKLDPDVKEQESEEAKIEKIKAIKAFFKKAFKVIKKVLKIIKPKVKSHLSRPSTDDREESPGAADEVEVEMKRLDPMAEIEELTSSALDSILSMGYKTPTDDEEADMDEALPTHDTAHQESLYKLGKIILKLIKGKNKRG